MGSEILQKLKIIPNCVYETIFTTYDRSSKPNAAPMGIITPDMEKIVAKIFTSSQTYRNIKEQRCAVINIINDMALFYRTSLDKKSLEKEIFKYSKTVNAPILASALAYMEVTVDDMRKIDEDRCEVIFSIQNAEIIDSCATPVCRAPSLILESLIHATRIELYYLNGTPEEAEPLVNQVKSFREIITRIAKGTIYDELMEKIWRKIQNA
ncbi:MAG: DUF447 family protein [Candidatus Freyarchaeota archaeon]|nr:DUF447 family protein [Candidatus Jordarchaeia archaeon]MBS7279468.1 DUF447 family protein [Candidatus Jordarchaeia archaeon]